MMKASILFITVFHKVLSLKPPLNTCPGNDLVPPPRSDQVPEISFNTVEFIQYYGYPIERHGVQTSDGYLLEMHRIPSNIINKPSTPVLLMHGLLSSSADWVITGPGRALAFLLADLGYDVWMGNARGNVWSRGHISLNPDKDAKFWDFSGHEIAVKDLPAMIDYMLLETGQDSLIYVGHSLGTAEFFGMASFKPDYNKKIRYMAAFAPVAFVSNIKSPIFRIPAPFERFFEMLIKLIGLHELLPSCGLFQQLAEVLCNDRAPTQHLCADFFFLAAGSDPPQLNYTRIPLHLRHFPAGASTKEVLHAFQLINSGRFRPFDNGPMKNVLIYGGLTPPDYNLSLVTAPVGLYYSSNDLIVTVPDVRRTQSQLGNPVVDYLVPYYKFNHLDFMSAIDVVPLLYNRLIDDIQRFS